MVANKLFKLKLKVILIVNTSLVTLCLAEPSCVQSALGHISKSPDDLMGPITTSLILVAFLISVAWVLPIDPLKRFFYKKDKQVAATSETIPSRSKEVVPLMLLGAKDERDNSHQTLRHNGDKKIDQMLLDHKVFTELLLNSTAEGICGFDLEGICVFVNRSFRAMVCRANNEKIVGRKVHDLIRSRYSSGFSGSQHECWIMDNPEWKNSRVFYAEELFFREDSSSFPAEYWIHPITHNGENIGGVISIFDITAKKNLEKETEDLKVDLLKSEKFAIVGKQLCRISHDFNNVLSGIRGYTELVLKGIDKHDGNHERLRNVITAATRGENLIKEISLFSTPGRESVRTFNILFVINDVLRLIQATIPNHIIIKKNFSDEQLLISGKQTEIFRVLLNIIKNAITAMGSMEASILEIEAGSHDYTTENADDSPRMSPCRYCKIKIVDNGCGMDKGIMENIYEPYFTTNKLNGGTGLGLSIANSIVAEHNGHMKVNSLPGKGTCFQIFLPMLENKRCQLES